MQTHTSSENTRMKAVGYQKSLPVSDSLSLQDIELPIPTAAGHDLLVKVNAIAVNPVDYKIRQAVAPENSEYKVLGWDAVGEVVAVGESVSLFQPGDKVFYAGDLTRAGSNAEFQLVDERIVGHQPKSLPNAEAAALPLTAITAWELLFEHLQLRKNNDRDEKISAEVLLVTGAAGGVGSILLQLAKTLTNATIIATASRESSRQWVKELGADFVVNHRQPLEPQIQALQEAHGIGPISHVASLNGTESYYDDFIAVMRPFGKIAIIDDPANPLDPGKLKMKSLSLHTEFMFARSMFQSADMIEQHHLLNQVAELIDTGSIKTTLGKNIGKISAENLRAAHEELESGTAIGKIVLEGFN